MSRFRIGLAGVCGAVGLIFCRLALAQADAANEIPFRSDEVLGYTYLGRVVLITVLGIALAVGAAWLLRRTLYRGVTPSAAGPPIQLMSYKRLTPRLTVYVVEIGSERVAVMEAGGTLLHVPLEGSKQ